MATLDLIKRDVVVSIRPIFASKILDGTKKVELRRRFPEGSTVGALALIYSSSPVRAIIGYARINKVLRLPVSQIWRQYGHDACISKKDFDEYFHALKYGFAILLADVKALRKQVTALDLERMFGFVAPQSFCYIGEEYSTLLNDERLQVSHRHQRRNRS
jgi:predicted transcriptional regulator